VSAVVYSACLTVAAAWYALQATHLTVADPPELPAERAGGIAVFLDYFRSTVPQQCGALALAIAGFAAFFTLTDRAASLVEQRWPARMCRLGSALFITAQLVQLGGYRYLYEASANGRDPETDLVTLQLVDAIDDALELGAFALLAAGMLGLGASSQARRSARAWSRASTVTGLLYLALAGAMAVAAWTVVDALLIVGGVAAAPIWAFTLAHTALRRSTDPSGEVADGDLVDAPVQRERRPVVVVE
jgi:hypothetical protein